MDQNMPMEQDEEDEDRQASPTLISSEGKGGDPGARVIAGWDGASSTALPSGALGGM